MNKMFSLIYINIL